jgi:hypothetical protein
MNCESTRFAAHMQAVVTDIRSEEDSTLRLRCDDIVCKSVGVEAKK